MTSASDDRALDKAWIESLVRAGVFSDSSGGLSALDDHLSQIIADTSNAARAALATACGAYLAQHCVLVEPCVTHEELRATLDALAAAAPRDSSPVGLARLVERARAAGEKKDPYNASLSSPGQNAGRDASTDPPGLRETVAKLFDEWARVADLPAGDAAIETFLVGLANSELLQNDEQQERFLRILVELAVTHCLGSESAKGGAGAGAGASRRSSTARKAPLPRPRTRGADRFFAVPPGGGQALGYALGASFARARGGCANGDARRRRTRRRVQPAAVPPRPRGADV